MATNGTVIYGRGYRSGKPVQVAIADGIIQSIEDTADDKASGYLIAPGLTDLQVNGYAGSDLNTDPLLPETVRDISVKLWSDGVTTFFPTVITNSPENILRSLKAVANACRLFPEAAGAVGGIHLEGPFISPEDGARGAHPAEHVRPPDWDLFNKWQEACNGMIRIVTLSPEWPGAAGFIRKASDTGVIVAIGHTAATPEQIREAAGAGATLSTHLGNGSHQMLPRHRNYIWEQLAADELYATMISDGFHLPDALMKVFLRMKPGRMILVSDATSLTGMPPGDYSTHIGGEVTLTGAGRLHMKGNPDVLAGSGKSLLHCVETLASKGLATLAGALDMAGRIPYRMAGLPGECLLTRGGVADLVMLREDDDGLRVVRTIKAGETVFISELQ
ncbi:MAG: amidohydrolase family protein [Bacteroidales bacterium]|nr:amidohydrolase family protein [Bacteroidales bacterium]